MSSPDRASAWRTAGSHASELARLLVTARSERGWSQERMAAALEATQPTVARWEAGQAPQLRFHPRIAAILGVATSEVAEMAERAADNVYRLPGHDSGHRELTELQERLVASICERIGSGSPMSKEDAEALRSAARVLGVEWGDGLTDAPGLV